MAPTQNGTDPSDAFLAQSQQPNLYAAAIIPYSLSICAVIARLWCRWTKRAGYKSDDILIIFALVSGGA